MLVCCCVVELSVLVCCCVVQARLEVLVALAPSHLMLSSPSCAHCQRTRTSQVCGEAGRGIVNDDILRVIVALPYRLHIVSSFLAPKRTMPTDLDGTASPSKPVSTAVLWPLTVCGVDTTTAALSDRLR